MGKDRMRVQARAARSVSRVAGATALALVPWVFAAPATAGGSGIRFGSAVIASSAGGLSGDGGVYDNTGADEVSFGSSTKGPFGSNFFFLRAGGPRSPRVTTLELDGRALICEETIFTVTSTVDTDWFTDGGTTPVLGQARLLCDPTDSGGTVELRWGYGESADCVVIERERPNFAFSAPAGCVATVSSSERGSRTSVGLPREVPFRAVGTLA